jgi:hypothetical protein
VSDSTPRASENQPGTPHDTTPADQAQGAATNPQPSANGVPPPAGPNPFDPVSYRVTSGFAGVTGTPVRFVVPVKKPDKEPFIRVHSGEEFQDTVGLIELRTTRELYLVTVNLHADLALEPTFCLRRLLTCITAQGAVFFWPLRLPKPDGSFDDWGRSEWDAARYCMEHWGRVGTRDGSYQVTPAAGAALEPRWDGRTFPELIAVAFRDKVITTWDHDVLRTLRGENLQ